MTTAASQPDNHRLGDFEIVGEIGRGGMGIVYEARQVSLNRRVALKVLSGGLGLTPKAVQRFHREAEAAAKLHHTNIVPVYATGDEDGTHFYAMELIDGPSLDQVVWQMRASASSAGPTPTPSGDGGVLSAGLAHTGPYVEGCTAPGSTTGLSSSSLGSGSGYFDTVARMLAEVADALEYAHQQGVIHRDMKPSNLLLSPAGRLSINDFGLARLLEQPGMTMSGEFVGTPAYMSPEQITAGRVPLDHRTDIYSLGATLYELLTLEPPHTGESREQVLAQIVHKEPKAPRRIQKKVPVDLETICLKCLEKDPDRRYQTAGKLAEDLRRYVNRFAISARRVGPVGRLVKWVRRRPAVAAAMACAAVAVAVAGVFAYQAYRAEQQRRAEVEGVMRERALEKGLEAAMGGDLEKAEKAILEAEDLGASTAQLRMLRGLVAFCRGDWQRALANLEAAVEVDADSVAARGMLAMAYLGFGDWTGYAQTTDELKALSPRTAEDYLFKGYALRWFDFDKALQNLDEAVKRGHSPLARAIRADVRMVQAEGTDDLAEAERAVADVQVAKEELADNACVLSVSLWVHVLAANLYLEAEKPERRRAALEEAERDARALRARDTLTFPFETLMVYFEQTGQEQACIDLGRRAHEKSDAPIFAYKYALALYRKGQVAEGLRVLEGGKWKVPSGDALRACILAERHPQNLSLARAACDEMAKRHGSGGEVLGAFVLHFLGDKRQDISENKLLDSLKVGHRSRGERFGAHYEIALKRLAEGDRAGAREHFRQAVQTRLMMAYVADLNRCFLARMEKDPTWPPWIPLKKEDAVPK